MIAGAVGPKLVVVEYEHVEIVLSAIDCAIESLMRSTYPLLFTLILNGKHDASSLSFNFQFH